MLRGINGLYTVFDITDFTIDNI